MQRFLARAKSLIPVPAVPLVRDIYYVLNRFALYVQWRIIDATEARSDQALPPAKLRFRVGECASADAFLQIGKETAQNLEQALVTAGASFRDRERVLDFGCGSGRTLRWLCQLSPGT